MGSMRLKLLWTLVTTLLVTLLVIVDVAPVRAFDENLARFAFDHTAAAYAKNPNKCIRKYAKARLVRHVIVPCDAIHNKCGYFIAISERMIVVAFRGTQTKLQLITEIVETMSEPKAKFEGGGAVQHYFNTALNTLWPTLLLVLRKLIQANPKFPILFTGHSLGGALASLASARFAYNLLLREVIAAEEHEQEDEDEDESRQYGSDRSARPQQVQLMLVTFGEPRVGNHEFARIHDRLVPVSYRIVHRYDLVAHLPSCAPKFWPNICIPLLNHSPYHHGTEVWYPNDMRYGSLYRFCNATPIDEDSTCSNKHYLRFRITDHLYYYNEYVSDYGRRGCKPTKSNFNYTNDLF